MCEVSYNWIGTDGFEVKNQTSNLVKTSNLVISRSNFDEYGREMFKNACRTCSTIIWVFSTNNITAFWRCRCRSRCRFLNSLLSFCRKRRLKIDRTWAPGLQTYRDIPWLWLRLHGSGQKIDKRQYGTIPKSCTTHALVSMIHNWHVSSDGNSAVIRVVLFDFRKAFDHLIDHNILVR